MWQFIQEIGYEFGNPSRGWTRAHDHVTAITETGCWVGVGLGYGTLLIRQTRIEPIAATTAVAAYSSG